MDDHNTEIDPTDRRKMQSTLYELDIFMKF